MNKIKKAINILRNKGLKIFWSKIVNRVRILIRPFYIKFFIFRKKEKIIREMTNFKSADRDEIFNFIFKKYFGVFSAMQIKEEFSELMKIVENLRPKNVLEIGTANGGALFCFSRLSSDDGNIVSVDLPEGKFGGGYEEWRIPFFESFKKNSQKLHFLRDDSHKDSTLESVIKYFNNQKIDFLFIDGDHTYEGVKKDFEMYGPLVKEGGVIAFHDIAEGSEEYVGGVPKFWKEVKEGRKFREFVDDWSQGGYGIGILFI